MELLTDEAVMSLEDMIDLDDENRLELIDGKLVAKNEMGAKAGGFAAHLFVLLGTYIDENKLGPFFTIRSTSALAERFGVRIFPSSPPPACRKKPFRADA